MARSDVCQPSNRQSTGRTVARSTYMRPITILVAVTLAILSALAPASSTPSQAASNWLNIVNSYRALAGLGAVTEDTTLDPGAPNHSQWMLLNQTLSTKDSHTEVAGTPGYTESGKQA